MTALVEFIKNTPEHIDQLAGMAWGLPFILMLLGTGAFFTFRLGFIMIRRFGHAVAIARGKYDDPNDPGDITHFQALAAALSATVGVGNIAGVATAIHFGGPGAVFWMLVFGLFGMTMKYATCTLGLRYREIDSEGRIAGGPMYYIKNGLGNRFRWLAFLFALSTAIAALGIGNMVQSNTMADAFVDEFEGPLTETFGMQFLAWEIPLGFDAHTTPLKIGLGLFIAFLVGLVIIGGIKRIGAVAAKLVPIMAVLYVLGALVILFVNLDKIPGAFLEMFRYAFGAEKLGAAGGGMAGIVIALSWGARRAIFSNEAGLGSAPIAHAAAKTKEPVREGLIAGLGPFVDTIVICTITALVIIITGAWHDQSLNGAPLTKHAFKSGLPEGLSWFGGLVVAIGLILFAISTAISWSYYGNRAVTYMAGTTKLVMPYRWLYVICLFVGANVTLSAVWAFADMTMALMAFFNLVGVIGLAGVVFALTKEYFSRTHEPYKP